MSLTIAPGSRPVLTPTSWVDYTTGLRTFCDTRLAINQATTLRWTLLDDLMQFPRTGVGSIGIWRRKIEDFGVEDAVARIRESDLRVSSVSFIGGFTGTNGLSFEEALADGVDAIQLAADIGAPTVTTVVGGRGDHIMSHAIRTAQEGLAILADTAAEAGVQLAVMPMRPWPRQQMSFLQSLDDALDMITEVDHPAVRLAFHTYHLWDVPRLLQRIPEIAPLVASVHLSDWGPTNDAFDQLSPGDGCAQLPEIVQAFDASAWCGSYELNVWSNRLWKADYSRVLATCVRFFHEQALDVAPAR